MNNRESFGTLCESIMYLQAFRHTLQTYKDIPNIRNSELRKQ